MVEKAGAMLQQTRDNLNTVRNTGRELLAGARARDADFFKARALLEDISRAPSLGRDAQFANSVKEVGNAASRLDSASMKLYTFNQVLERLADRVRSAAGQAKGDSQHSISVIEALVPQDGAGRDGMIAKFSLALSETMSSMNLPEDDAFMKMAARLARPGGANLSNIFVQEMQGLKNTEKKLESGFDSELRQAGEKLVESADIALRKVFGLPGTDTANFDKMMSQLSRMPHGFMGF